MNKKELQEKGARLIAEAQAYYKEHLETWDAEKQAAFDKMMDDAAACRREIEAIERRETQLQQAAGLGEYFTRPVQTVSQPAPSSEVSMKEAFSRYANGEREFNEKVLNRINNACRGAFEAFLRGGPQAVAQYAERSGFIGPNEMHALLSTDNTLGGFLVNDDMRAEIIKAEAGYAVLAPLCRVEPTNSSALVFPKMTSHSSDVRRTSGFTGQFQNEGYVTGGTAPTTQDQPTFAQERIAVHSWQPDAIEIGKELLEDTGANIISICAQAIAECLAFDKDDKILNGAGSANNEPEGVLQAGITTVNSGGATSIVIGGILGVFSEVPAQYRQRATWIMSSRTMGAVLQLNTGTGGVYLFPPNQWNDTILSRPVKFLDYGMDQPTAAGGTTFTAGEYPIIFGDFSRYVIAQRQGLAIQRLVERFAPNIGILPTARIGGQVVLNDAFRVMTVSA